VGFNTLPEQYPLIWLAPQTQDVVLSLNASSIYLGQGIGVGLGSLAILYGSLASLGWVAALKATTGLIVLLLGARRTAPKPEHLGWARLLAPLGRDGHFYLDRYYLQDILAGPYHAGPGALRDHRRDLFGALHDELVVDAVYEPGVELF
jgi:hypothetical protein